MASLSCQGTILEINDKKKGCSFPENDRVFPLCSPMIVLLIIAQDRQLLSDQK